VKLVWGVVQKGSLLIAERREVYPSRLRILALHLPRILRLVDSS
jgi:hypothetical protein